MWVGGCVTAPTAWASPHWRRRRSVHRLAKMAPRSRFGAFVYTVATRGSFERPWGRRSVHKWEDRASPRRIGAFVYTVATREDRSNDRGDSQECTQIGQNGLSVPFRGICVHCCDAGRDTNRDASCVRWHERLSHHGVSAPPPRWPLSLGREDRLCASGVAARLASWPRRQPTRTPEEPDNMGVSRQSDDGSKR